ncbi:hypothetical protein G7Y79_00030g064380 [Physcia stellaris]|nr:hypothetical protein G7Y79_00030g064380 [Physcia stellaris]
MPLREFTSHEKWVINDTYNRLQLLPTVRNPTPEAYLDSADVPGKGRGYLARKKITRGTRILEESPFLWVRRSSNGNNSVDKKEAAVITRRLKRLPNDIKTLFSDLSPAGTDFFQRLERNAFELSGAEHLTTFATGIFLDFSKAGDLQPETSGIFQYASLFNHSCIPNAHFTWNPYIGLDGRLTVHAIRDIALGDEVVVNYRTSDSYEGRAARMRELRNDYGFDCTCPICDTQSPIAAQSEQNRRSMRKIVKELERGGENPTFKQRQAELTGLRLLLDAAKMEQMVFPQQADIYGDLAEWCAREGAQTGPIVMGREESHKLGLEAAREKLQLEILCTGERSSGVEESLDLIARIS